MLSGKRPALLLFFSCSLWLGVAGAVFGACRDCAQPGFGGPGENRFTAFDSICRGDACLDFGTPQLFVNLSSLSLYVRVTDLAFGAQGLALERSYNMDDTRAGAFGPGWSFTLGESLTSENGGSIAVRRGSGRIDRFAAGANSGTFFAVTATGDSLAQNADGSYTLRGAGSMRQFSSDGRLLATQDATLDYDGARLTAVHYRGRLLRFTYDASGRIASVSDSAGRTVTYGYTAEGRLAQAAGADGRTIAYRYDASGLLTGAGGAAVAYAADGPFAAVASVTTADGAVRLYDTPNTPTEIRVIDGNGDTTLYTANALGETVSVTDGSGTPAAFSYDPAGRRTRVVNGAGETAAFAYDASGNLTSITDGAGGKWTGAYGANGLTQVTDPRGNVWQLRYDTGGSLTSVADPLNGTSTATRTAKGQIASITDARGNQQSFEYDSDGLLTKFTNAAGGVWSYQYDGAARVSARTDPGGGVVRATYTAGNRIASLGADDIVIPFDAAGQERDASGRLTSWRDSFGNQLSYGYDAAGQLSSVTLPGGKVIAYQYDHAHRLSKVTDWQGNFALYRYDLAGSTASVTVSGGPVTVYQYDAARRLRSIVSTGADGAAVAGYRYTYDASGNRTAVSALEPLGTLASLPPLTLSYDVLNRPVSRSDGQSYRYDARGNLTSIQGPRGDGFAYDALGRLSSVGPAQYGYDATGLRVSRGNRRFVYDLAGARPRVVMETDETNAPIAWYVHGQGLLWKVAADGTVYFYHFDGDGNVVAMSSPGQGVVNQYRYDPLGRLAGFNEKVENAFRARGESGWVDDGNGVIYTGVSFELPDLRLTLPANAGPAAPLPGLLPRLSGPAACFFEGVANCAFAGGRRER